MKRKTRIAAFTSSVMAVALLVMPLAQTTSAATATKGSSSATLTFVDAQISDVPQLGDVSASLGELSLNATTQGSPFASVLFTALQAGGEEFGSVGVNSNDDPNTAGETIPISGPGVSGNVTIVDMAATADATSAEAVIDALAGQLALLGIDLAAGTGTEGVFSRVDSDKATSRLGLTAGPQSIDLVDLLPQDVIDQLPLSVLVQLADELNLDLESIAQSVIAQLSDLQGLFNDVQAMLDELGIAEADLDELLALQDQLPDAEQAVIDAQAVVDAAQIVVDDAQVAVNGLTAQQAALNDQIADLQEQRAAQEELLAACPIDCAPIQAVIDTLDAQIATAQGQLGTVNADLANAQGALADALSALDDAQGALAAAQAEVEAILDALDNGAIAALQALIDDLQATLTDLLTTIHDLLVTLPDLDSLLADLRAELANVNLLEIGNIDIAMSSLADAKHGEASVDCSIAGVSALGESLGVATCDELFSVVDQINDAVRGVLDLLPGSLPRISVRGLEHRAAGSSEPDIDGWTRAFAEITPLNLTIEPMALQGMADDLVAQLMSVIDGLDPGLLPDADEALLDELRAQLEALPTGAGLEGLSTMGFAATVAGAEVNSEFNWAAADDPDDPDDPEDPEDPEDPSDPDDPNVPQYRPPTATGSGSPLAFTGAPGTSMMALAALAGWSIVTGLVMLTAARVRRSESVSP